MKRACIAFLCLLMASCASATPPLDVTVKCPPLREWSKTDQTALADAMSNIPRESVIWAVITDWITTRDAIRACRTAPNL